MDQFLDPETDTKHQFLDPETVRKCQFLVKKLLDPETDIMDQFLAPETDIKHQFLDPETDKKCQFLDGHPETDVMDQFLDPETDIMGEGNYIASSHIQRLTFQFVNNKGLVLVPPEGQQIPKSNGCPEKYNHLRP